MKMGVKVVLLVLSALVVGATVLLAKSTLFDNVTAPMNETEQADVLIQNVAKMRSLKLEPLEEDRQVAYGTLYLQHIPGDHVLRVAVLVAHDPQWNTINTEFTRNYLAARAALLNPAIGGMFDSAGGAWRFDEATGKTYLYREFPLDVAPQVVDESIEGMSRVVSEWEMRWLRIVARIAHGKGPAPVRPETIEDNHYRDQL